MSTPESGPPRTGHSSPYEAFRHAAFRRWLFGSLFVHIGTAGQSVAIGWQIYSRTDDPLALGMVGLVQAAPMLLLTLPAGYLADRFNRRKLLMLSMAGATLTSLALAGLAVGQGPIWLMYLVLLMDSSVLRLGGPARTAMLPLLVPPEVFENSVKWRTSLMQMSGLVGPALGGFVVAWSVPGAYLIAACSSMAMIGLLTTLKLRPQAPSPRGPMLAQLAEGIRFVWHHKLVLGPISLDMFAVLLGGAVYLLPIYARDILGVDETGFGFLRAAPAAGAMCMGLLLAHLPPMRKAGRTLLLSVAGFGAVTIVFGISTSFWLSLAMLFLTGVFDNVSVVIRHTLVQMVTPDEMRGRVSAVNSIFIGSSNELGGFESGLVARLFGPVVSVVSGGIGCIGVVGLWAALFPRLRRFGMLSEARPERGFPLVVQTPVEPVAAATEDDEPAE